MRQKTSTLQLACGLQGIVSGGQTGVDRAALDVAAELDLPRGGWCPRGRIAEDGVLGPEYPLRETLSRQYQVRTRLNVRDSDATLILARGPLTGGTEFTRVCAERLGRPLLVIDLDEPENLERIRTWLTEHRVGVLNVAGPRESTSPGVYEAAAALLRELLHEG